MKKLKNTPGRKKNQIAAMTSVLKLSHCQLQQPLSPLPFLNSNKLLQGAIGYLSELQLQRSVMSLHWDQSELSAQNSSWLVWIQQLHSIIVLTTRKTEVLSLGAQVLLKSFCLQAQLSYRREVIVRKCSSTDKLALSSCPMCRMDAANLSAKSKRVRPA